VHQVVVNADMYINGDVWDSLTPRAAAPPPRDSTCVAPPPTFARILLQRPIELHPIAGDERAFIGHAFTEDAEWHDRRVDVGGDSRVQSVCQRVLDRLARGAPGGKS